MVADIPPTLVPGVGVVVPVVVVPVVVVPVVVVPVVVVPVVVVHGTVGVSMKSAH
jgi:hypothetical protein